MKYHLEVLDEVYFELESAGEYYHHQKKGLEFDLLDEFETIVERISQNPESYQKRVKRFRFAFLSKFPFLIVFEIIDNSIVILLFLHVKRHPNKRIPKKLKTHRLGKTRG